MKKKCAKYAINIDYKKQYEEEVKKWIDNEWIVPHDHSVHGEGNGMIPLMAVFQPNQGKKGGLLCTTVVN